MSAPGRNRELLAMVAVFGVLPAVFLFLVLLPSRRRVANLKAQQEAIAQRLQELPTVQPLSRAEHELLDDPSAPWRERIPFLPGDAARLAHYHRVITDLQRAWQKEGIPVAGVRSTWDPIKGSFTLPAGLDEVSGLPGDATAAAGQPQAWVLEAGVGGSSAQLFKAFEALPQVAPVLEPVGLRWETGPQGKRQTLILRNLVLLP